MWRNKSPEVRKNVGMQNGAILPRNDWEGDAPERNDAFEMPEGVYGQPKE